ncbi:MAG: hypothetical protein WCH30_08270, partial [Chlorobiaceae bacterium]
NTDLASDRKKGRLIKPRDRLLDEDLDHYSFTRSLCISDGQKKDRSSNPMLIYGLPFTFCQSKMMRFLCV